MLSGMLSRIPDLGSRIHSNKREGRKKFVALPFFVATKITKFKIILILNWWRKKDLGQFTKNYRTFYPKIVINLSKIWVWDPGSDFRDPEKTYSGSGVQGSKRHRIPDPNPQHWPSVYSMPPPLHSRPVNKEKPNLHPPPPPLPTPPPPNMQTWACYVK